MTKNERNWNETYQRNGTDVPWFMPVPSWFKEVTASINPCRTLDVGCGLGQYAHYLKQRGFDVTGVDFSPEAISLAKKMHPGVNYLVQDALSLDTKLLGKYDFMYDVSLLHHLSPEDKKKYAGTVAKLLNPGGTYICCAFDTEDKYFDGKPEFFSEVSKTTMYPVTQTILQETFADLFVINKIKKFNFGKEYDKQRWLTIMRGK